MKIRSPLLDCGNKNQSSCSTYFESEFAFLVFENEDFREEVEEGFERLNDVGEAHHSHQSRSDRLRLQVVRIPNVESRDVIELGKEVDEEALEQNFFEFSSRVLDRNG